MNNQIKQELDKINSKLDLLLPKREPISEPPKPPKILVPENIKITREIVYHSKGILFNDNKQELVYNKTDSIYKVYSSSLLEVIPCELIPCKREDLVTRDLAFRSDIKNPNLVGALSLYCIILNSRKYVYITDCNGISFSDLYWTYWWKVVEVKS